MSATAEPAGPANPFPSLWHGRLEPDFQSQEWKDAIGWILGRCPSGTRVRYYEVRLNFAGFLSPPHWHLEFWVPGQEKLHTADALLTAMNPAVTLTELERAFGFGDASRPKMYVPPSAVPVPHEEPWASTPRPENPLGSEFAPGKRFAAAGEASGLGTRHKDTQGAWWEKKGRPQIGGAMSVWWERTP